MDNNNNNMIGNLPVQINKDVPVADTDAQSIVKLVKSEGRVVGYELSNGQQVTKEEGIQLAKSGRIKGVAVAINQGNEYLRSLPDSSESNNLNNLSSVESNL